MGIEVWPSQSSPSWKTMYICPPKYYTISVCFCSLLVVTSHEFDRALVDKLPDLKILCQILRTYRHNNKGFISTKRKMAATRCTKRQIYDNQRISCHKFCTNIDLKKAQNDMKPKQFALVLMLIKESHLH